MSRKTCEIPILTADELLDGYRASVASSDPPVHDVEIDRYNTASARTRSKTLVGAERL